MSDLLQRLQTSLADRYAVERELGRGGMATVFLARDVKHGRQVAIKVLSSDVSVALGVERFQREIEIASTLTHPHIVPLYDSGEADGCLFYAMPFITGESLRARLDREKQLPLDDAIRITCEVASALDYAHRNGVLHRDVKPANILLEDGHAVIADFGIARAISRAAETDKITMTGVTLGTPTYMSPEQASGEHTLDGRSDIYALACVLYEMLVGQPPFTGPNAQAVMARHALETVPSLRVVRTTIPEEVEDAILCALSKAPADRFATAQQFADALRGGATGMTMRFTSTRAAARARQQRRRTRIAAGALAAVLLLASGAGAWWLVGGPTTGAAAGDAALNPRRIAVLYFQDDSRQGELGFFADALSEQLIEQLRRVVGLQVVSRDGVAPFRGGQVALDSIANALSAGTIVRGSVAEAGDSVLVAVRLIDGNTSVDYDRAAFTIPRSGLASAGDTLARQVEEFLRESVGDELRIRRDRRETDNPEAWVLVHRAERARKDALALFASDSADAARARFALADSLLARAEMLDPDWARPIAARAELAFTELTRTRPRQRQVELIDRGITHADRALAVDPQNAAALEYRGTLRVYKEGLGHAADAVEAENLVRLAEEDLTQATTIDRTRASAWSTLSLLLYRKYDRQGANLAAQNAYDADAFLSSAAEIIYRLYATSWDLEAFPAAARWCDRGRQRFPERVQFLRCQLWILTTPEREPNPGEAWRLVDELQQRVPASQRELARREAEMIAALVIDRAGHPDSARRVIERARAGRDIDPAMELVGHEVIVRAMMGDSEEALRLLGLYLTAHPDHRDRFARANRWELRRLRDDPDYRTLVGTGP